MRHSIEIGSVLALLSVVFMLSGCERLSTKIKPEIDYELLADMVAERVDERLEMRELQRERQAAPAEEAEEIPPADVASKVSEEVRVQIEEPVEEKSEEPAEIAAAAAEREQETPAVEVPPEVPKEVPPREPPKEKTIEIDGIDLVLVEVPAGEFLMGSPAEEGMDHERPQHKMAITRPFWLGKYEVTQAQWRKVMGSNPSYFKGNDLPVESVSWDDAQKFIAKLNAMTDRKFRLPTEAEWEYACRAESEAKYCFGDNEDELDEYAWYSGNSEGRTHPVGQKKPNQFGLYDTMGNVWEWCADWYSKTYYNESPRSDARGPASGKYRILRGGAWYYSAIGLRSANRYYQLPEYTYADTGLRIAQDAP